MYFDSNIKLLRKRRKLTQDEVAEQLSMKRSTLSGYENRVAQPGLDVLLLFSSYYKISVDTILKVDLGKLSETQLRQLEHGEDVFLKGGNLRILASTVDTENQENIELVPVKAQAGYTNGFADPEYISELQVFQLPFLSEEKRPRNFTTGRSPDTRTDMWENLIEKEGKVILYSLNPLYEPYDIHVSEIREIWKFVHFISHEIPDPVIPENQLVRTVAGLKQDLDRIKLNMNRKGEGT